MFRPRPISVVAVAMVLAAAAAAHAGTGALQATYPNLAVTKFVLHPTLPYIYATVWSDNSVAVINTNTLALEAMVPIGSSPRGLAITPDGSRVYVANASSDFLGVLDTASRTALPAIYVGNTPRDVEVGADGRLYVLTASAIRQIDPATGASLGPNVGSGVSIYSGELEISPTGNRLYYADYGISPASLYQFDVTVSPAVKLWESPHGGTSGSNGQDLCISHDGSFISYPCGAGQGGYRIAKYRTSDMAILGTFDTGAYPREIAFSPDDAVAYTMHTNNRIEMWDTKTFLPLGAMSVAGTQFAEASELCVDRSGQHLFAAISDTYYGRYELRVYDTGRQVPEPSSAVLGVLGAAVLAAGTLGGRRLRGRPAA